MRSLAVNGFTTTQVEAALAGLDLPPQYRIRVELLDNARNVIDSDYSNLILSDSSISYNSAAEVSQRTGRFMLKETDLDLDDYSALVISDSPLFYLRLGESAGPTASDSSGNGRNGTYTGGVTFSETSLLPGATDNSSVKFNGSTGYVSIADASWMDVTTAGSWEAWIKTTASGAIKTILARDDVSTNRAFELRLTAAGKLQLVLYSAPSTTIGFPEGPVINDGIIHHVVATYDGAFITYFVDGIQVTRSAATGTIANVAYAIHIGSLAGAFQFWDGWVDEAAFYGRTISPAEIREHYKKGAAKTREVELLTDRLKLFVGIKMASNGTDGTPWAEWPCGEFLLSNPRRISTRTGKKIECDAYDKALKLSNTTVTDRYIVATSVNVITAVNTALTAAGLLAGELNLTPTTYTTPAAQEWERGTSYLVIVNDLLKMINYLPLYFDGDGMAIARPYQLPAVQATDRTYEDNSTSVIVGDIEEDLNLVNVPNQVIAIDESPDTTTLTGTSTNNEFTNDASVPRTGKTVDLTVHTRTVNQTTLDDLADRELTERTPARMVNFQTWPMPFHEHRDKLRLKFLHDAHALDVDSDFIETEWSLSLNVAADPIMRHRCKEVVDVV